MICPNCGTEQPESFECIRCGIVFARFEEHLARQRDKRARSRSQWKRPIGLTARCGRLAVGFACVGLAIVLFLSGKVLAAKGPLVAVVFFGVAGLYFILTVGSRIVMWRFAAESLLLAVCAGAIALLLPDVFSLSRPMYHSTSEILEQRPLAIFLERARARISDIREFLSVTEFQETDLAVEISRKIANDPSETAYKNLSGVDATLAHPVHARLASLKPLLNALNHRLPSELPKGPASFVPQPVISEVMVVLDNVLREIERLEQSGENP